MIGDSSKSFKVPIVFRRSVAIVKDFEVLVVFRRSVAVVKSFRDLIVFRRSEVPVVQKSLSALVHFEAKEEVLLAYERVQARKRRSHPRPLASAGEKEKKSSPPLSE